MYKPQLKKAWVCVCVGGGGGSSHLEVAALLCLCSCLCACVCAAPKSHTQPPLDDFHPWTIDNEDSAGKGGR